MQQAERVEARAGDKHSDAGEMLKVEPVHYQPQPEKMKVSPELDRAFFFSILFLLSLYLQRSRPSRNIPVPYRTVPYRVYTGRRWLDYPPPVWIRFYNIF